MKRKYLLLILALLLSLLQACNLATPRPQETPTAAPEAPVPASDNPCNNILYPLAPGQQMIYKTSSPAGETQLELTVSSIEGSLATVDMLDTSSGIVTQSTIECDAGAIKTFPLVTMGSLFGSMLNGGLQMDYVSGYIAPREADFIASNWDTSWESQYVMNGQMSFNYEGESATITIDNSPVLMQWQVVGTSESIDVPAGSYTNAIKVTRDMTTNISVNMNGMDLKSTLLIKSNHWFAPQIGMLKTEITEISVQYMGMKFPVPMNETMELVEFRPAE